VRNVLRYVVFLACIGFTASAAYNVMVDDPSVQHLGEQVACGDEAGTCVARMTSLERTPFARTFDFATSKRSVHVKCTRAFIMVGDYACAVR
jgi:hypothetical protein